jgi:hypothetical protein
MSTFPATKSTTYDGLGLSLINTIISKLTNGQQVDYTVSVCGVAAHGSGWRGRVCSVGGYSETHIGSDEWAHVILCWRATA